MAYHIKVDIRKVAEAISKDSGGLAFLIPKHSAMPHAQIIAELLVILQADRLALTDAQFRFRYVNYIKK